MKDLAVDIIWARRPISSLPRRRASRFTWQDTRKSWIPAFAGMTRRARDMTIPRPTRSLLRADQEFLAGRLGIIARHHIRLQSLFQRKLIGIMARKGGLQLLGDARAKPHGDLDTCLGEEIGEQPATDAPGHAIAAAEHRRRRVEPAVQIDLLVMHRT